MQAVESAVIAAAGLGSRLGLGVPKCLLDLEGRTILSRMLESLEPLVDRIHVVVGYREDLIIEYCAANHPSVVLVRNPEFRTTNSAFSFALGARALTGKCLFLDGDLLAVPASMQNFVHRAASADVLIGLTAAKSENAVFAECDADPGSSDRSRVTAFSRDRSGPYEWANIVAGPARLLDAAEGFVFERLETLLPAEASVIELCEVDTASDFESAKAFVRSQKL